MKNLIIKIAIFVNIALYLTCIALWVILPQNLMLNLPTSLFTIALTFVLYMPNRKQIETYFFSRYSKRFFAELTGIFLIGCILLVLNYVGAKNIKFWDLSSEGISTLSDQSLAIIKDFKDQTNVTLYAKREQWDTILRVLKLYQIHNPKINLNAVEIETQPHLVKANGITTFPTIVFERNGKKEQITTIDELNITNAFLKLADSQKVTLYYTQNHGELDFENNQNDGISILKQMIHSTNYELKPINLAKESRVPTDASAILSLGPVEGYLEHELEILKKYFDQGGKFVLAVSPDFKGDRLKSLKNLLSNYGIQLNNDLVIDRLSTVHGADATIPIVEKYSSSHRIMKEFKGVTIFPMSLSITSTENSKYSATSLLSTSAFPASWAESNLSSAKEGKVSFDQLDKKGPIDLAVAVEEKGAPSDLQLKMVIFGSASFMVNGYATQGPNLNLFLNSLSWVVGKEGLISLNRPVINQERILMSEPHLRMVFYFTVLFSPLVFFGLATYFYRRRMKL